MLYIAICDDDAAICRMLERMIAQINQEQPIVAEVAAFYQGEQLWQALKGGQSFDVIFLDVNMPQMDGIQLGRRLREELGQRDTQLVYISGDASYALPLYDNYPLHFLVKDDQLTVQKVQEVLERALTLTNHSRHDFFYIKDRMLMRMPIGDIRYFESVRKKIYMHQKDGQATVFWDKLDEIERRLRGGGFVRIHKSYLINGSAISQITATEVKLSDQTLPISRAYQKSITKWLEYLVGGGS